MPSEAIIKSGCEAEITIFSTGTSVLIWHPDFCGFAGRYLIGLNGKRTDFILTGVDRVGWFRIPGEQAVQ
ncbi:hypothetical protein MASR1M46_14970 [Bacteroidales bacterium]